MLLHRARVLALVTILARLFPMTLEVRNFLRQYHRVLLVEPYAQLPASVHSLQNRCVSVLQQEVLADRIKLEYIASKLPPAVYNDVFMSERELLTVATVGPTAA